MAKKLKRIRRQTIKVKGAGELSKTLDSLMEGTERRVQRELNKTVAKMNRPRGRPRSGTLDNPTGTGERMKTSLYLDHSLLQRAKQRARVMGLSLNAFTSIALFHEIERTHASPVTSPVRVGPLEREPWSAPPASRPAPNLTLENRLFKKFGHGFTFPGMDDAEPVTVLWVDVERYAAEARRHIEAGKADVSWVEVGRRLNLDMETARAADVAAQSDEFRRYMEMKYGA